MNLFKNQFRKESIRLKSWDYRNSGWYFVTINTNNHREYFGKVMNGRVVLSEVGRIAEINLLEIPKHYPLTELDSFIIMPNHIHGIIIINNVETGHAPSLLLKHPSLGNIIGSYKSAVTRCVIKTTYILNGKQGSLIEL
ncbi:MAG: hypothetical protein MUF28_04845 [Ignavibacterium sp.]|jgi:REP element-mobilizing transposase RayT|nr:hypothetical protein [Ignavibacterium sp.]